MIDGLKSLNFKLSQLGDEARVRRFLSRAGAMVERDAKTNCPVDTGDLRNSITYEVNDDTCVVGTNVEYAPYVHQGTGIYAVDGDGRDEPWSWQDKDGNWHTTVGQRPQPFLTKALDSNTEDIKELFRTMVREVAQG